MTKLQKPGALNTILSLMKSSAPFPDTLAEPLRNVGWKIQSKTPTAALTNHVSTDWPQQRKGVGQNQTNPIFH